MVHRNSSFVSFVNHNRGGKNKEKQTEKRKRSLNEGPKVGNRTHQQKRKRDHHHLRKRRDKKTMKRQNRRKKLQHDEIFDGIDE